MTLRSVSVKRFFLVILTVGCPIQLGCTGTVDQPGTTSGGGGGQGGDHVAPSSPFTMGASGIRRLSRIEYDNTLRDLLGDTTRSGFAKLPEDVADPFDNDYHTQLVSGTLIASAETLATEATLRALSDPARRAALVGCTPAGPADAACLDRFVATFGRRAFRRPLTDTEKNGYLGLQSFGVEDNNFYTTVDLVIRAILQDASFLYRVEVGDSVAGVPGIFRLNDYEIGARLSYFLWATTPNDQLLDLARDGKLGNADTRRAAAATLLASAQGRARVDSFHAFWLGYNQLPFPADLAGALRSESDALVEKIVFGGGQDYFQLFRADETFLTDMLATHYGLPLPGTATGAWVPYGANPRRGILSHGTVLSAGAKFDDTSPTLRGVFVRNRLLCQDVPPPPPTVAVDEPPMGNPSSRCKSDRYAIHRSGGCANCHNLTDPIGFGLENYDRAGKYRTTDKDAPECTITGDGEVSGVGKFNGPAALGEMLIKSGNLERCIVTQAYRLAMGRREVAADGAIIESLATSFINKNRAFDELLLDLVSSAAFVHRQVEE
jgi:Protein of unknown function (DUF1588)/Protein of unknown function (DUF1592)/Protein of unknown function (DUF1595)/Protein of unknown function (DUF1585)/Protein of unknown function (DUF1587)